MGWLYSINTPVDPGPLPRYSSAPKFPRVGTKWWKASQFLHVHGPRQAVNSAAATSTPPAWLFQSGAPASTQSPQMGMKIRSAGLLRPVRPQASPNSVQRPVVIAGCSGDASGDRMRSATTSTQENRNVVSEVSHTQRTAYCMAAG